MRRISEQRKKREHRGEGSGANYKPYIQAREFNSLGTCSNPIDWKTGRTVELLSQTEKAVWYLLRWDDQVTDIQEQYPLELSKTVALSQELGIRHPKDTSTRMTTDFLVTLKNKPRMAVSVKASRADLESNRTIEKLYLEKQYWKSQGVPFSLVFKSDVNMTAVNNIRLITEFYSPESIFDEVSALKHLIAQKLIHVDLAKEPLNFQKLLNNYREVVEKWMKSH